MNNTGQSRVQSPQSLLNLGTCDEQVGDQANDPIAGRCDDETKVQTGLRDSLHFGIPWQFQGTEQPATAHFPYE